MEETNMQAAVVPAKSSPWQMKDIPQPQPGPNQVLVKMHASGICYTDVHETLGHIPGEFPRILGHEPVGEIVAVAPDVSSRKVGDRVGTAWVQATCGRCEWCQRGRRNFCPYQKSTGLNLQGGHAEYMLMYADSTFLIPDNVSYEQAAPIFCAGYTVWSGLRWAAPKPHERVAVHGIGGLGHLAVQYAKAAGFDTIAISHSPDKDKMIRELGADEVVRDGKSLAAAGGADIILSTTNSSKSMTDSIQALRPDGRLVIHWRDGKRFGVSAHKMEAIPISSSVLTAERKTTNSSRRFSTELFAVRFSAREAAGVRPSAFAKKFVGKLGGRSETSISNKNSFVTISERRSTTEPDRVAPALSHCSSLKPLSASSSRFFPAFNSTLKFDF
jgi:alcohol dehydrogenase